ncbi:MAG: hypothetical protein Q4E62_06185 [Sutterellaceae bacterium]|nr:hypothetical protein [Sutterellaceae bacterium]
MSKKELRLTDTLEPEGGDFVRFLSDIEKLQKKDLRGLEVELPENNAGMIVVSSRKEAAAGTGIDSHAWGQNPSSEVLPSSTSKKSSLREPTSLASLFYFLAPILLAVGIAAMALGMYDSTFELVIPVGMFFVFAGIVGTAESKKDAKRRARARGEK